ncbi:MAG: hypothetical protein WC333_01840 [Dehalococcoidia bacterium]
MSITGTTDLPGFTGDTNPSLLSNHYKRVFKIPVGDIPKEEIEDYVREIAKKFKNPSDIMPDLDCGIYPIPDYDIFLPTRNDMSNNFYMQSVPNSHWWPKLGGLIVSIEQHLTILDRLEKAVKDNQTYYGELLTKEHIIIGLENSIKHGYKLKPASKDLNEIIQINDPVFISIEQMIEFVKDEDFDFKDFLIFLQNTVENKLDLDNGLKMFRQDVYKRIDKERDYQDLRWNTNLREDEVPDEEKPVSEWLNYIEFHLSKAKNWNYHLDKEKSLAELRKVAALAVRAMEIHGCPERIMRVPNIEE